MAASLSTNQPKHQHTIKEVQKVTLRFAGDSGDGMQLTGSLFSDESALLGNDLATFPDYPSEIRAPAGTVAGVSSFQVQIGSVSIHTPGDLADVLVAMNPAAVKANLPMIRKGAVIIVDSDSWTEEDLKKAGIDHDLLDDEAILDSYKVIRAPITSLTHGSLAGMDLDNKSKERCKNMFCLGMMFWLYNRPLAHTEEYIKEKFAKKPLVVEANLKVLAAGFEFAQTIEEFESNYRISKAAIEPGLYRQVSGNQAVALGMIAAAKLCGRELVLGSYPITPATDILHELARHKEFGVKTVQMEDEIGGICVAIGASYAGALALTTTSGPGLDLKTEAMGLAVIAELPLVIINVQRGGPSTGLPTKTEQSDLFSAIYGRHGECPMPVIAAYTPGQCFDAAIEASRLAIKYMTPVILLSDGYLANGSEPWHVPNASDLPPIRPGYDLAGLKDFTPYLRDEKTLARPWVIPGMTGLEHRIGGLEKQETTGHVSYDPANHEVMVRMRQEKIDRIADDIPLQKIIGEDHGELLVVGWGGTYGALVTAVNELKSEGKHISLAHITHLKPLPKNLESVLTNFKKVVVCELNMGQLFKYLRAEFALAHMTPFNKVQGLPFTIAELTNHFMTLLA